jgi:lipoprotein-anchoring transpeptidase ErfK/SrfK
MKKPIAILLIFSSLSMNFSSREANTGMINFLLEYLSIKYSGHDFDTFLYVAVKRQKLFLIEDAEIIAEYSISTAAKGLGNKFGSLKTPQGLHMIAEKIGENVEPYGIIKQKVPTGKKATPIHEAKSTDIDLITSRVLHLTGVEEGVNSGGEVDSYKRGIFIHGTHEEGLIGTPASKGCVRMYNADVIELFERIEVGTFVVILNN